MTIRKALFTLSLALPLALAGCPSTEEGGSEVFPCSTTADCAADAEICHPIGKICVPTCTEASDCPDNQNECAVITLNGSALTTELVCQCKTGDAAFCTSEDTTVELVCSSVDNICETKCTTNDDCAAFTTVARECVGGECVLPALCTPTSCTNPAASKCGTDGACAACTADADCAHIADGKTHCDAGTCVVPTCNQNNNVPGTAGGPDICAYGEDCTATGCAAVPAACAAAASHTWNQAAKAPVITKIVSATPASTSSISDPPECASGGPKLEVVFEFYAPNGLNYSGGQALLDSVKFQKGTSAFSAAYVRGATSGMTNGTLTAGICLGTLPTLTDRFIFMVSGGAEGNAACLQ